MAFGPDDFAMEMGVRIYGAEHAKRTPMQMIDARPGGWSPMVREPFMGAWQENKELTHETQLAYNAVYACVTRISNDVGKLRPRLVEVDKDGIWTETESAAFSPVLRKPNRYQNHIQFKEWWLMSKLARGNAYALLQRDGRGLVVAMYMLDPGRVEPLVSPDGAVYYRLHADSLAGVKDDDFIVPASEIAHDRMNCLFHPLVGISPLYACGIAAGHGLAIQKQSSSFFGNGARPSGILTAPGSISQETANRVESAWQTKFTGEQAGRVAVLGDGLKYEPMIMSATDAQLIEQLKMTAEIVCSVFHVPPAKIGLVQDNNASNAEIRDRNYYSDCLGSHIEQWELCMDGALGVGYGIKIGGRVLGVDLDVEGGLWRMDTASQANVVATLMGAGAMASNEARRKFDLKPVKGGDSPMLQQQNWSLAQLADRKAIDDSAPVAAPEEPDAPIDDEEMDAAMESE